MPDEPTASARPAARVAVLLLLAGGLGLLLHSAVRSLPPLRPATEVARRFWAANAATRLANSPPFRARPALTRSLLEADGTIPLSEDVLLLAGPDVPPGEAAESLRLAAYVLAPRRVVLSRVSRPGLALEAGARRGERP